MNKEIKDRSGRLINLRKIGVLEQLRLFKALGPNLSENHAYMGLARIAASAESIDGIPIPFPSHEDAIEAILQRLGDDGVEVIGEVLLSEEQRNTDIEAGN